MKVGFELEGSSGDWGELIDIDLTSYMFKVTQCPLTYFGFPPPEATPTTVLPLSTSGPQHGEIDLTQRVESHPTTGTYLTHFQELRAPLWKHVLLEWNFRKWPHMLCLLVRWERWWQLLLLEKVRTKVPKVLPWQFWRRLRGLIPCLTVLFLLLL